MTDKYILTVHQFYGSMYEAAEPVYATMVSNIEGGDFEEWVDEVNGVLESLGAEIMVILTPTPARAEGVEPPTDSDALYHEIMRALEDYID